MRPLTSRLALFGVAIVFLAGMGVAHGLLTNRWSAPDMYVSLDRLPFAVGDWDGTPVDSVEGLPAGEPGSVLLRRYVNRVSGAAVTLFLTTGPAGPIGADARQLLPRCGFRVSWARCQASSRRRWRCANRRVQGSRLQQDRTSLTAATEGFLGLDRRGPMAGSGRPAHRIRGEARLYKMYVIRQMLRDGEAPDEYPQFLSSRPWPRSLRRASCHPVDR